jgi:hypothetical protein
MKETKKKPVPFEFVVEVLQKSSKERKKEHLILLSSFFEQLDFFKALVKENGEEAGRSCYKTMSIQ